MHCTQPITRWRIADRVPVRPAVAGITGLTLLLGGLASCSSAQSTVFVHPLADFALIQRVAVLPVQNLATPPNAGEWVRQILSNELLAHGLFEVVEPWEVNRVLTESNLFEERADGRIVLSELSVEEIATVSEAMDAQALLFATVMQFERARTGTLTAPDIGMSLRLVDSETGLVIWSATDSRSGVSFGNRLVGMDGPDLTAATSELVRSLLLTLGPQGGG